MIKIYSKIKKNKLLHIICNKNSHLKIKSNRLDLSSNYQFMQTAILSLNNNQTFLAHKHIWKRPRFKKMITQLIDYSDNLRINIEPEVISISVSDINQLKSKSSSKNLNSDDDYLEVSIIKNIGFSVVRGYNKRSHYKDTNIFDDLESLIKERLKVINKENFSDIWNTIMVDSGLIRDNNLLDILKDN
jgi:hypothetical protein